MKRRGRPPHLALATAGVAIAIGVGLLLWALTRSDGDGKPSVLSRETPVAATAVAATAAPTLLPTPTPLASGTITAACPGGPTVPNTSAPLFAYTAADQTVWVIDADGNNATQLICDGTIATWSPSGRYMSRIAADGTLRILDVQTGNETVIDSTGLAYSVSGVRWADRNDVLFYQKFEDLNQNGHPLPTSLWRVEPGSSPSPVLDNTSEFGYSPNPDGSRIAYTVPSGNTPNPGNRNYADAFIYLVNSDGSDARRLTDGAFLAWSPGGRLFAFWRKATGGSAIHGDVNIFDLDAGREFSVGRVSSDQRARWAPNTDRYVYHNWEVRADSRSAIPLFDPAGSLIDWSPDGTKVAYIEYAPRPATPTVPRPHSLVVLDITTGQQTIHETSTTDLWVHQPGYTGVWSPDSRYYAFVAGGAVDNPQAVAYVADTQTGTTNRLPDELGVISFSPDGRYLLLRQAESFWLAAADGTGPSKLVDSIVPDGSVRSWVAWRPAPQ